MYEAKDKFFPCVVDMFLSSELASKNATCSFNIVVVHLKKILKSSL